MEWEGTVGHCNPWEVELVGAPTEATPLPDCERIAAGLAQCRDRADCSWFARPVDLGRPGQEFDTQETG